MLYSLVTLSYPDQQCTTHLVIVALGEYQRETLDLMLERKIAIKAEDPKTSIKLFVEFTFESDKDIDEQTYKAVSNYINSDGYARSILEAIQDFVDDEFADALAGESEEENEPTGCIQLRSFCSPPPKGQTICDTCVLYLLVIEPHKTIHDHCSDNVDSGGWACEECMQECRKLRTCSTENCRNLAILDKNVCRLCESKQSLVLNDLDKDHLLVSGYNLVLQKKTRFCVGIRDGSRTVSLSDKKRVLCATLGISVA
jgi:hypothetical protein